MHGQPDREQIAWSKESIQKCNVFTLLGSRELQFLEFSEVYDYYLLNQEPPTVACSFIQDASSIILHYKKR